MQIGDHVVTPRIGYTHHGLYLGNKQVMHYEGSSLGDLSGRITQVSLEQFCQGNGCTVREYPIRIYGRKESVQRAYTRLGEAQYDVLLNNCEQFVAWCIMGIGYSEQINSVVSAAIQTKSLIETHGIQSAASYVVQSTIVENTARQVVTAIVPTSATIATVTAISGSSALIVSSLSIASVTPLAVPIAAGAIVGYGVKKLIDWVW